MDLNNQPSNAPPTTRSTSSNANAAQTSLFYTNPGQQSSSSTTPWEQHAVAMTRQQLMASSNQRGGQGSNQSLNNFHPGPFGYNGDRISSGMGGTTSNSGLGAPTMGSSGVQVVHVQRRPPPTPMMQQGQYMRTNSNTNNPRSMSNQASQQFNLNINMSSGAGTSSIDNSFLQGHDQQFANPYNTSQSNPGTNNNIWNDFSTDLQTFGTQSNQAGEQTGQPSNSNPVMKSIEGTSSAAGKRVLEIEDDGPSGQPPQKKTAGVEASSSGANVASAGDQDVADMSILNDFVNEALFDVPAASGSATPKSTRYGGPRDATMDSSLQGNWGAGRGPHGENSSTHTYTIKNPKRAQAMLEMMQKMSIEDRESGDERVAQEQEEE